MQRPAYARHDQVLGSSRFLNLGDNLRPEGDSRVKSRV